MIRKRKGKTLTIKWAILTNGEAKSLENRNLSLQRNEPTGSVGNIQFETDDNVLIFKHYGREQKACGLYKYTLWENYGSDDQSVVDSCDGYELVSSTCEEDNSAQGISVEEIIELKSSGLSIGVQGKSAYEIAVANGFVGSETEWLASLKGPKGDPLTYDDLTPEQIAQLQKPATDAATEIKKTETEIKEAEQQRKTEFTTIKSDAETATKNANDAATNATEAVKNALLKTEQTLTEAEREQVQKNIGVKDMVDFVFGDSVKEVTPEIWQRGKVRAVGGGLISKQTYFVSQPIKVNYGDEISLKVWMASRYSAISEVLNDDSHTYVRSLQLGSSLRDKKFIADKTMYIEYSDSLSAIETQDNKIYVQPVNLFNIQPAPYGGYLRNLFEKSYVHEKCRPVFNTEEGVYELNGLKLNEQEMVTIYNDAFMKNFNISYTCKQGRTNLVTSISSSSPYKYFKADYCCFGNNQIEILILPFLFQPTTTTLTNFTNCSKLREIRGVNGHDKNYGDIKMGEYTFNGCTSIEYVLCNGLNKSQNFCKDSPYINYESVKYLIDKAKNTEAITITVHPTTYSYLTGTAEPTEQVGGTTEEWQAIVTSATEKNISFATTE